MLRAVLLVAALAALALPVTADAARAPISAVAIQNSSKAVGKQHIFTETLTVKKTVIAHDRISCVLASATTENCTAVFTFTKGGTISVKGQVSASSREAIMKIVGSTGAYAGSHGTMDLRFVTSTQALERFSFT